jgi:hypothetical protein
MLLALIADAFFDSAGSWVRRVVCNTVVWGWGCEEEWCRKYLSEVVYDFLRWEWEYVG